MNIPIKKADIKLYNWIEDNIETLPHNSLYYNLLDWKYAHQEVRNSVTKIHDCYTLRWLSAKTGQVYEEKYDCYNSEDPYQVAREYFKIDSSDPDVLAVELWRDPNPYGSEAIRNGVLLDSFERED